ncbi:MAG: asparagine synthase (glutamine-hydrolyzing) [bacterium]|nr:asparagine synthase (glutamine-hydrolyzing) [bacterium]
MCGITGIYDTRGQTPVLEGDLTRMRDTMHYRGPDSAGIYISFDGRVGLGHRRLAILDLSPAGHQPMNYDKGQRAKDLWITYNGEVYNFKELRGDLQDKGYTFKSQSDTEVILAAYAEWGPECVKRFNGMFAFAIWDEANKILFAARDHVGIKPFYYSFENGVFLFGSEIKAILAHPSFKKELCEESVPLYLTFGCVPAPHTLFQGVKKLPAAHCLLLHENGKLEIKEFWNPLAFARNPKPETPNPKQLEDFFVSETKRILEDSIRMQMVSDVPFGCFLSGGIDSSTNAALMGRALGTPVETFSIGVKDFGEKYNEFEYSRRTAELLGARRHETLAGREELLGFLPEFAEHADDPQADFISFLVYYLAKLTRDSGVIVAQVGEGADELFAGYPQYPAFLSSYHVYRRFSPFSRLAAPFFSSNPYVKRLVRGQEPYWGLAVAFSGDLSARHSDPALAGEESPAYAIIKNLYSEVDRVCPEADMLTRMAYIDLKIRLAEFLLMRVDKMAMAHSVETRVPFLDHRLVELAFQIPESLKLKHGTTKYILKQAVRGVIPDEIINRKKQGFGAPVKEWLRSPVTAKEFTDIIFNSKIRERGLFDYDSAQKLISAHQSGKADNTFRIWTLITLSLWYDRWIV